MKQTILFVDDDPTLLSGLQRMLRPMRTDWAMTFVSDSSEAVQTMNSTCFDVVVTDMRMPTVDGAKLLAEVRNLCPHSVRIVLSGQAELEIVLRAVEHAHQYISKPCDAEVLKEIIKQACALKGVISNIALKDFIAQIRCLPVDSTKYHAVRAALESGSHDLDELGSLFAADLGMATKLLQLVNSSFFTSTRAPTCHDAVKVLGLDLLTELVLRVGIFADCETHSVSHLVISSLNEHSIRAAQLVKEQAQSAGMAGPELAHYEMAGFLHDVGRLVLATFARAHYEELSSQHFESWSELLAAERQMFGASHQDVGAYFLRLWGFEEGVVQSAAAHHDDSESDGPFAVVRRIVNAVDQRVHRDLPVEPVEEKR